MHWPEYFTSHYGLLDEETWGRLYTYYAFPKNDAGQQAAPRRPKGGNFSLSSLILKGTNWVIRTIAKEPNNYSILLKYQSFSLFLHKTFRLFRPGLLHLNIGILLTFPELQAERLVDQHKGSAGSGVICTSVQQFHLCRPGQFP